MSSSKFSSKKFFKSDSDSESEEKEPKRCDECGKKKHKCLCNQKKDKCEEIIVGQFSDTIQVLSGPGTGQIIPGFTQYLSNGTLLSTDLAVLGLVGMANIFGTWQKIGKNKYKLFKTWVQNSVNNTLPLPSTGAIFTPDSRYGLYCILTVVNKNNFTVLCNQYKYSLNDNTLSSGTLLSSAKITETRIVADPSKFPTV